MDFSSNGWKFLSIILIGAALVLSTMLVVQQSTAPVALATHVSTVPDNSVHSSSIINGDVGSADIGTGAVFSSEIANGQVSGADLSTNLALTGRLAFTPFTVTVPSEGTGAAASFGLSDVTHNFIEVNCQDGNNCLIPGTTSSTDINPGVEGQILTISITPGSARVIVNEAPGTYAAGVGVNLDASSRTIFLEDDSLQLLYQNGEWTELNVRNLEGPTS